jgi:hypothetical protein
MKLSKVIVQPIFTPSFIVFKGLNLDNKQILEELEELPYIRLTEGKVDRSDSIKILNEIKSGEKIKEEINLCLNHAIKDIWKYNTEHTIVNSWITKTFPKGYSQTHVHKNFWLSAIYYPFSQGQFKICFESDRPDLTSFDINTIEYNFFNTHTWEYPIDTGDLIIFSANLKHKIARNDTEDTRYSIAVNILPKGEIGQNEGLLYIK